MHGLCSGAVLCESLISTVLKVRIGVRIKVRVRIWVRVRISIRVRVMTRVRVRVRVRLLQTRKGPVLEIEINKLPFSSSNQD